MKKYKSKKILKMRDLYGLQDTFSSSGIPFKYKLTKEELGWLNHIQGKYSIASWILGNIDRKGWLTFDDSESMSKALQDDGIGCKAVMLSDETALQRLFFWLSKND